MDWKRTIKMFLLVLSALMLLLPLGCGDDDDSGGGCDAYYKCLCGDDQTCTDQAKSTLEGAGGVTDAACSQGLEIYKNNGGVCKG